MTMARNKSGQQSALRLLWVVPGYKKQKGTSPQRGLHGQNGPDRHTGLRFAKWSVGIMVGWGMEVVTEVVKRWVSICCLQEVRWKGEGARFLGVKGSRYEFLW